MKRYYCTYFDRNYLVRAISLIESLNKHENNDFQLFAVCHDEISRIILKKLNFPNVTIVPMHKIEQGDAPLIATKKSRSLIEYYWTAGPTIILWLFEHNPGIDVLTYLDADLFFFSSPDPIFDELGDNSVLIHEHRFPPSLMHLEANGKYNVGLLCFRNDEIGLKVLNRWRQQCIEWCYIKRSQDGKFGDQVYLNDWPRRFEQVTVLQNVGAGVAPWNHTQYSYNVDKSSRVFVNGTPLVFYHFHDLKFISPDIIVPFTGYPLLLRILKVCYLQYVYALSRGISAVQSVLPDFMFGLDRQVPLSSDYTFLAKHKRSADIKKFGVSQTPVVVDDNWDCYCRAESSKKALSSPHDISTVTSSYDVSIILCTKDRAKLLDQMLASLKEAAGRVHYEVIVVEGGSSDNTLDILRKYNVTKVYSESEWLGPGRHSWPKLYNFGFSKANGKWAMYASDDITFSENCISKALEILNKQSEDVAGGIFYYKNLCSTKPQWADFGIDFTYGQKLLMNYGLLRLDYFRQLGGFDESYRFYCADGDLCLKLYEKAKQLIPLPGCFVTHNNVLDVQKEENFQASDSDIELYSKRWRHFVPTRQLPNPKRLIWQQNLLEQSNVDNVKSGSDNEKIYPDTSENTLQELRKRGLLHANQPLRLHLGCGEQYLQGYINIDYPQSEHTVMQPVADFCADMVDLAFPPEAVDEIRLHHVFEHFDRVEGLGLLIRWHTWLRMGGTLRIETPDFIGSAKVLLSQPSWKVKMGIVRHLSGDHASSWGYHLDHWFAERFEHTLSCLGFNVIDARHTSWSREPFLANVEITAVKTRNIPLGEQKATAEKLLQDSTVAASPGEERSWQVWRERLDKFLRGVTEEKPSGFVSDDCLRAALARVFCDRGSQLPIDQITDFNQRSRDRWVAEKAANISPGSRVLDVGAGTCPYRSLFSHCDYKTHDFKKLEKIELRDTEGYGQIDYVSDITNIPVEDASFDVVICTEVLEHTPEPIKAIAEMTRILRPGGQLLLTAPLGSGLHQLPFHFYGGFTPQWYKHFLPRFGLELQEVQPNGGFFKMLAQECARVEWTLPKHRALHGNNAGIIQYIFGQAIPRYLFAMDERCFIDQFTVGYHIRAAKTQKLVFSMKDNVSECIGQNDTVPAMELTALIFSKDRALQLQATIDSFLMYCRDSIAANLVVLFKASNQVHRGQYERLKEKFPTVAFVEETNFGQQVLSAIENCKYVLFLVDDNIFVKPFSLKDIIAALDSEKKAVGFSLRLGKNTTYCYTLGSRQKLPAFDCVREGILKYYWPGAECDFGYPLELSSSVYRSDEILRLLKQVDFSNPNTLESEMSRKKSVFVSIAPFLLTFEQSVTFCNPINVVQRVYENNKFGTIHRYTSEQLADCFSRGMAIDVQKYVGFTPDSAHQEVELYFKPADRVISEAQTTGTGCEHRGKVLKPKFSIVMANYNNDKYIGQAIESVLSQTFTDWELIIVDDCSTDDSLNIIKKYLGDTRIKLVQHKENRGYTAALKTGIANVQSEYFGILDSDDCLLPNAVETMLAYHVKFPDCGLIYSQFAYCHPDLTQRSIGFCDKIPPGKTALDAKVVSHFKTFKLRDYLKTSGYDETILYAEDIDIVYKMEEVTGLKFVDECLYLYREMPTSICHSESKINVAIMSRVKARINALKRRCAVLADSGDKNFEDLFAQAIKQARATHKDVEQYFVILAKLYENNLLLPDLSLPADVERRDAEDRLLWLAANVDIKFDKLFELLAGQAEVVSQPFVTVYMVTYNAQKFIAQAIDSVLSQVYKNFEFLIVDDGSTDKTKELVASYSDNRIRYIYKEHKNYASGVNRAVAEAKGKYIMVVDSDDFIAPDYIGKMVAFAEEHPQIDYFYPAQLTIVNESGNPTGQQWSYTDFSDNSVLPAFLFKNGYGPIPNPGSLKRKTLFDKVGLYDEVDTVEDFVFLCKNALKINFKRVDEHSTYFYRRHRQSNSLKFEARNRIMADVLNEMVSIYPAEVLYPRIENISDSDSKEQRYYEYVVETFCRHSNGPMVQFGHYFQKYADYYKSKLLRITAPEQLVPK